MGVKTRRYSGFEPFLDTDSAVGPHGARFRALLRAGVPACFQGRSLFSVAKLLRWTARTGIIGCDLDQVNSHFSVQALRYPDARCLNRCRCERDSILRAVARSMGSRSAGDDEGMRDAAEDLFIILGYGGGVDGWCKEHGVPKNALPCFVQEFADEHALLRREDVAARLELYRAAKAFGHERPGVKVQATPNLEGEREALDAMERGLKQSDCCPNSKLRARRHLRVAPAMGGGGRTRRTHLEASDVGECQEWRAAGAIERQSSPRFRDNP